jgi:hypothetical protein
MYGAGSSWLRSLGRTLRLGASTSSIGRCFWYDLRAREQVGTHDDEQEVEAALKEKGLYEATVFTTTGPAVRSGRRSPWERLLQRVRGRACALRLRELLLTRKQDFVLALTIFACLDPTNLLVPPATAPWVIALA